MTKTRTIPIVVIAVAASMFPAISAQQTQPSTAPQFTTDGKLKLPADYREWVYVTSGVGMSYSAMAGSMQSPAFDNVFVRPESYRAFMRTGKWPDGTMFVLELRASSDQGSILKSGRFQKDVVAIEASVKDERRFPDKWAYFGFEGGTKEASPFPKSAGCLSCHQQHAAVDNTFVQFYPTLLEVATRMGTLTR